MISEHADGALDQSCVRGKIATPKTGQELPPGKTKKIILSLSNLADMPPVHYCGFCHHRVPTVEGIRKHYARSKDCDKQFKAQIQHTIVSVFDDEINDIPLMPSAPQPSSIETEPGSDSDSDSGNVLHDSSEFPMPGDDFIPHPRQRSRPESPSDLSDNNQSKRVRVEEVEDEDAPSPGRFPVEYPRSAGEGLRVDQTVFEKEKEQQDMQGGNPWAPFDSKEEWELASWLITHVGQSKTDDFLKLPIASDGVNVPVNLR